MHIKRHLPAWVIIREQLQAHHGLQQEWAKSNLAEYGYNPKSAPTTTLESNTAYDNEFGTTSGTLEDRLVIGANQMIDKLNSNSADKIEAGELDQLTYNREKIEAQLHDEKKNEDKENEKCP